MYLRALIGQRHAFLLFLLTSMDSVLSPELP
jgi:hypothetical protein